MIQNLRKIALVLDVSGTAIALKNTRLYQGSFGFVGLQVYVPITPNRSADSMPLCTVHRITIDGEGVRTQYDNEVYNLLYVDTAILNGNEYLLFERPLPKTFTDIEGDLEIVINYSEIKDDVITSRLATNIYKTTVYAGGTADTDLDLGLSEQEAAQINANTIAIEQINETIAEAVEAADIANEALYQAGQAAAGVTILDAAKLDKKTTVGEFVYSHNGETQGEIAVSKSALLNNSIVQRDGAQIKGVTPIEPNDLAVKGYVDVLVAALRGGETTYDTLKKIVDLIGAANGIASLDADGKLTNTQIPAITLNKPHSCNSEAAMLALNAVAGDLAFRSDTLENYILLQEPASVLSNWQPFYDKNSVTSVNGKTGNVTLNDNDLENTSGVSGSKIKDALNTLNAAKLDKSDKYLAPISLTYDTDNECWEWDYSESDNAVIEMSGSEPTTDINITNASEGDIGVVTVKGGQLTLPLNSVLSADFGYITAVGNQYYRYSFYFDGTNFEWHRTVLGVEDD